MEQMMRGDWQSKVVLCECGKLHFTHGPLTLHFDKEGFLKFADSVGWLGAQLRQAAKDSRPVPSFVPSANVCH
jgi:hypothetical protein